MSAPKEITLQLTVDEVNLVLEAIGQLPFVKVVALVAKIQQQARGQIAAGGGEAPDGQ